MYRHLSNNYDAPYEQAHVGERPFDPGVVNCNNYDATIVITMMPTDCSVLAHSRNPADIRISRS